MVVGILKKLNLFPFLGDRMLPRIDHLSDPADVFRREAVS